MNYVEMCFDDSIRIKKSLKKESKSIEKIVEMLFNCIKNGNKILLCGNGGSAADSQHMAAELVNKFRLNRKPMSAISLTTDTSIITSISNDYGFEKVFEKQVEALGAKGDILIGITTSGKSENVIRAIKKAKDRGMETITLAGKDGIVVKTDVCVKVPSNETPRIQEAHITILHIICDLLEKKLFE